MGLLATVTITAGTWSGGNQFYSFACSGYDPAQPAGSLDSDPQNTQLTLFRNCEDSIPSWQFVIEATSPPAGWNAVRTGGMTFLKSEAAQVGGQYTWGITQSQSNLLVQDTETVDLEYWEILPATKIEAILDRGIIDTNTITNNIISR